MGEKAFLWEPHRYLQFNDFRQRPFFDLTARIGASAPARVVDLGCGPGNLTATLARRWPGAQVVGLDSSAAMVAAAREAYRPHDPQEAHRPHDSSGFDAPGLSFAVADITDWHPAGDTFGPAPDERGPESPAPDVVVSNAALQWVRRHRALMSGWLEELRLGAWLGVQVPGNFNSPSHVIMRELAASGRWRKQLDGVLRHRDAVGEPAEYQELFLRAGVQAEVWETTYLHLLQGQDPVLDWVRGTGLRPVLAALGPDESEHFEKEYATLLAQAYPPGGHGTVFPFRRIFMVGEKQ